MFTVVIMMHGFRIKHSCIYHFIWKIFFRMISIIHVNIISIPYIYLLDYVVQT